MKTKFTLLSMVVMFFAVSQLPAQIPNAGFENWTSGNPDDWLTNNVPTLIDPVTQETPSYSGTYAVRGEVLSFSGSPFPPLLASTDQMANGFPVSQMYSTFSFYYKMNITSTARFEASISLYDAANGWVGGGGVQLTGTVGSYTLLNIPISYIGTNPVEAVIIFVINDSVATYPPVGDYFIVDGLSFSGASGVHGISTELLQAYAFPNPTTDLVTLRTDASSSGISEIVVYNVYGQVVKKQSAMAHAANLTEQELSLAGLPAGIYSVRIVIGKKQWITKVARQ